MERVAHNLAFFVTRQKSLFSEFAATTRGALAVTAIFAVTADAKVAASARTALRRRNRAITFEARHFDELGFLQVPISFREIARRLRAGSGQGRRQQCGCSPST